MFKINFNSINLINNFFGKTNINPKKLFTACILIFITILLKFMPSKKLDDIKNINDELKIESKQLKKLDFNILPFNRPNANPWDVPKSVTKKEIGNSGRFIVRERYPNGRIVSRIE